MKIFINILLLINFCIALHAQKTLNIHLKSGGYVSYAFAEKPKVNYKGKVLAFTTNRFTVDFPMKNVAKLTFDDEDLPTNVESVTLCEPQSDGIVRVYDMKGTFIKEFRPSETGTTSYLLSDLPTGIYIVKTNHTSYKISKN